MNVPSELIFKTLSFINSPPISSKMTLIKGKFFLKINTRILTQNNLQHTFRGLKASSESFKFSLHYKLHYRGLHAFIATHTHTHTHTHTQTAESNRLLIPPCIRRRFFTPETLVGAFSFKICPPAADPHRC